MFRKLFGKVPPRFPGRIPCKICGGHADFFDMTDFSLNSNRVPLPVAGIPVPYYRCLNCRFLYTNFCDGWTARDFGENIYNEEYKVVDAEFDDIRPRREADEFAVKMQARKESLRLLDYGGGTGVFARRMNELGFDAASYDPFFESTDLLPAPGERFELLHCHEVIEHTPDPRAFVTDMVRYLADESAVYIGTSIQPPVIEEIRLGWWYVGPRNGHISLFSHESLSMLWVEQGFNFGSYSNLAHIAWRGNPPCLPSLVGS